MAYTLSKTTDNGSSLTDTLPNAYDDRAYYGISDLDRTHALIVNAEAPTHAEEQTLCGLLAEFEEHEQLLEAATRTYAAGYRRIEGFAPFPVEGLAEALGHGYTPVPLFTLLGGMVGGLGGYFMEWYTMGPLYPLNVGGRPLNSWPAFIPVTFELTVLGASLCAVFGMLALNRLPHPHHPVFNVGRFVHASSDRFYLCIEARDPKFHIAETVRFLQGLDPHHVSEVSDV